MIIERRIDMKIIKEIINQDRNVVLTGYIKEDEFEKKNPSILILPGGGYRYCSKRENEPVVRCYLEVGFNVFVLEYSVLEHAIWPNPFEDYECCMKYLINHAEKFNLDLDKIALIGFSAGGHLAAVCSCISKYKPTCTILGYPVILRETIDKYLPSAPDVSLLVNENTPPHFIFASRND